eukprot:scaffold77239_cov86-Cyclotella_meneghiniana.AAC.5
MDCPTKFGTEIVLHFEGFKDQFIGSISRDKGHAFSISSGGNDRSQSDAYKSTPVSLSAPV